MSSRSRLAAVANGLVIGWWSDQAVAQTEELDALHQRILAMDGVDQTFEAIPLANEYAAGIEARSGTDNAGYAVALDILVDLHVKLGRFGEAEPFARRSLAIRETLLSPEHVEVARSLNSLALLLEGQSKYEEAEHLVRRSLAIRGKALGPNNVRTAESANNLGVLLFRRGKNSEAEPYFRRALAILETAREKNEGRIAGALSGVASVLQAQQRSTESEPLYRRALAIAEPLLQQERALREKRKERPDRSVAAEHVRNFELFLFWRTRLGIRPRRDEVAHRGPRRQLSCNIP